jgi:chromosome partitioning protein
MVSNHIRNPMSKVIALFNQSGGVGKTTLTMNIGYQLAARGHKVLLVDLDPQASLTTFMGIDPVELKQTVYESIIHGEPLVIHRDIYGIDLVPANISLSAAEMELVVAELREVRLKDALEPVQADYDFVLIDCPPSLGVLSYISLVAARYVLVPIETQYKAFCGTELLLNTVSRIRSRVNRNLKVAGFIPTRFDSRNSQDERTLHAIQDQLHTVGIVYSPISRSTGFADASDVPLGKYNPKHPALNVLNEIATSLENLA